MSASMQLHFSVDPATAARLEREARRRGMSLSRYLSALVSAAVPSAWPTGYLERVVGACASSGLLEPPDGKPEVRETLDR
jgi:hypothetical protein